MKITEDFVKGMLRQLPDDLNAASETNHTSMPVSTARALLDELAKGFTPPQPNQWCKIVCRKDGEPVLVTRDWDSDNEVEVVRLELRKKFSMVISLHFSGENDTALADRAFAAITGDNVDDVLKTRGVDSIMSKLGDD